MISNTNFVYDYWYFQLAYLNFRPHENEIFYFISVPYTITNFQVPESLKYMPRGVNGAM